MEGVLHKRGRGRTNINFNGSWTERIVQVTHEERVLKYYDTQLVLKGSMVMTKDLQVRLVDAKEVEGRPNAFEISCGEEKIIFSSIMPSGAEKWFNFLKNFNKIIDQKVIKDEKEKQLEWVDGVVKSVLGNFKGNPIALRLNLQDMLKTNVALTKSIDVSTLICPEDVEAEMNDLSKSVRSLYMTSIQGALAALRTEAMDIVVKITTLLYKLSDAAMFQVSTQGFTHKLVGAAKDSTEVVLGLSMTGPVVCGNSAALRIWVQRVFQALRAILAHFLTGKSFNEKLFAEYGSCIAMAGLHPSDAAIVALIAEIRLAAAVSPVSLDERDITSQLTAFDEAFMKQYAVRAALELCAQFEPHRILKSALLCELDFDAAALWEAEVAVATVPAVLGEVSEDGIAAEKIRLTQIYPAPPAVVEEQEWDAAQAGRPAEST